MRLFVSKYLMLFAILLMLFQPAQANAYQPKMDDTFVCLNATQKIEKEFQIKEHMLTTISSVETGRWNDVHKQNLAWPWTINAEGEGFYYKSKKEAVEAVKKLQAKGVKSIDVGCMQINLYYHGEAFESLEEAFDPEANVRYGAKFLKQLHSKKGDWIQAAMAYHSGVASKANKYKTKVLANYDRIKQASDALNAKLLLAEENSVKIKTSRKPAVVASATARAKETLVAVPTVKRDRRRASKVSANEWREAKLEEYRRNKSQR